MSHRAQIKIPATYIRGGTSKGVFFRLQDLPLAAQVPGSARDAMLLRVIGSPDPYGKQIDGMGGATKLSHEFDEAKAYFQKRLSSEEYIDVHCWRFFPPSFELIISDLNRLNLLNLIISKQFETVGCEFYMSLTRNINPDSTENRISSLEKMRDLFNAA